MFARNFSGWNWLDDCELLEEINLSNTKMSSYCKYFLGIPSQNLNIKKLNFTNCDTSNVTNMEHMFENCSQLTSLDLSSFNTINVKWMDDMFYNCSSLTSIDVSKFNTSNVTTMLSMFYNCSSLIRLDLSSFDTSNVGNLNRLIDKCSKLTYIDVSSFDTSMADYVHWEINFDKLIHIKISDGISTYINEMSLKGNWQSVSDSQLPVYNYDSNTKKTTIPQGSGEYKRINSDTYYTISFVADGGSGDMPSQRAYVDEDTILHYVTFTREGYYFTRWRADNNVYYKNEANIGKVTEDLVLHAEWEARPTPKPRARSISSNMEFRSSNR